MDASQIREVRQRIDAFRGPVLSMYVGTGEPAPDPRELQLRVKSTLDTIDLGDEIRLRVLEAMHERSISAAPLGVFVELDTLRMELVTLPTTLGVQSPQTGQGTARVGAPYTAPLSAWENDAWACAALYVDGDRWRLFAASPSRCEELAAGERTPSPAELGSPDNSKQEKTPSTADRGDATKDLHQSSVAESRRRHYRNAAEALEQRCSLRLRRHVVLLGPDEGPHRVQEELPDYLRDAVEAKLSGLPNPDATAGEVQLALYEPLVRLLHAREGALIDEMKSKGVIGLRDCLDAWQQSRLAQVLLAIDHSEPVWVNHETGYVAPTEREALATSPAASSAAAQRRLTHEVLPELARRHDVQLTFATAQGRPRVMNELGGIGGLPRW